MSMVGPLIHIQLQYLKCRVPETKTLDIFAQYGQIITELPIGNSILVLHFGSKVKPLTIS